MFQLTFPSVFYHWAKKNNLHIHPSACTCIANTQMPDVSSHTLLFICLSLCCTKQHVTTERDQMLECFTMHLVKSISMVQKDSRCLCHLHHRPSAVSALSAMMSSSCLCSSTACNESESWHAQMINWWQRELIKEIKIGTPQPRHYTCTCTTRASSHEGIVLLHWSFCLGSYSFCVNQNSTPMGHM